MHVLSSREFVTVLSPILRSTKVLNKAKRFMNYFILNKFFCLTVEKLLLLFFAIIALRINLICSPCFRHLSSHNSNLMRESISVYMVVKFVNNS